MLDEIVQRFQKKGLKPTPQRLLVYEILAADRRHPAVEDIYVEACKRYPALSLNTVYKTLQTLVEAGEVAVIESSEAKARYEVVREPHHHFMCRGCGSIVDVDAPIDGISLPRRYRSQWKVLGYQVNFFGYCDACKSKKSSTQ